MDVPLPPSSNAAVALRRKKAKQRLITIAVVIVVVVGAYWYFERSFILPFQQVASFESSLTYKIVDNFEAPSGAPQQITGAPKSINTLTVEGVISDTNAQRAENGNLSPLAENATLDDIAMLRLDDMFTKQYFAHVAPDGGSAQTIASSVGYSYLALGENLAMGDFAGDSGVVTAWMNSPGHRANILNVHYDEIGVAVREGVYHGQNTWIAVQVFGKPSSDCTSPDPSLMTSINSLESQISTLDTQLQQSKADIDAMQPQSGSDYNDKVAQYNASVQQYNNLTAQAKSEIAEYNTVISTFNTCLNG